MSATTIEWATDSWNPVTGCTKISTGCVNCYAEAIAARFWGTSYPANADGTPRKFTDVRCHEDRLNLPLTWRKPRRVFVNSMSDLFHKDVPFDFVYRVFDRMAIANQHTFMILTKRPQRMLEFFGWLGTADIWNNRLIAFDEWPLANVWLGVSAEDQRRADERISLLLEAPAAVRFVSVEPMLGPVDLRWGLPQPGYRLGLNWVIAGCESGPKARACEPDWVRSLRDQVAGKAEFFLKQLVIGGKLVKEPELDGRQWLEVPHGE